MNRYTRRQFLKLAGLASAASALSWPLGVLANPGRSAARVVIIGGGYGGATCAKYVRKLAPGIDVTLVEPSQQYVTCPFSNTVIGGMKRIEQITHSYDNLSKRHGVKVIHDLATAVDATAMTVTLKSGAKLQYDKLVVAPGIDMVWNSIEGYDEAASEIMPHAWKAGAQTVLLRRQLENMKAGSTVVMTVPGNPFRCPPGPYERVSLIAHYLKQHKPGSKIMLLDAKDGFSKQGLFQDAWNILYPGMIEWVPKSAGGTVTRVDTKKMEVISDNGDVHAGAVINVIPKQRAGAIAHHAGLADASGWCPVNQRTFESTVHRHIHVIGDASIAGKMPKSGYSAGSQGKVCAVAVVAELGGLRMPEPSYVNTCYSLVSPEYGISVAAVYRIANGVIEDVKDAGGVSPRETDDTFRNMEAIYAQGWYDSTVSDIFG